MGIPLCEFCRFDCSVRQSRHREYQLRFCDLHSHPCDHGSAGGNPYRDWCMAAAFNDNATNVAISRIVGPRYGSFLDMLFPSAKARRRRACRTYRQVVSGHGRDLCSHFPGGAPQPAELARRRSDRPFCSSFVSEGIVQPNRHRCRRLDLNYLLVMTLFRCLGDQLFG